MGHIFDPWKPGDLIEAKRLNQIQDVAQRLDHAAAEVGGAGTLIEWVRLTEDIGPDPSDFIDRSGVIQYFDPATDLWRDTDPPQTISNIVEPTGAIEFSTDDVIPILHHWSGKAIPLSSLAAVAAGSVLCVAGSTIAALDMTNYPTSVTPGSGTVTIWEWSGADLIPTATTETAYNFSQLTVSAGTILQAKRIGGRLVIDFESCPAS